MKIIPTVKQNIYTEKSPDEVVNILRSVTLPPEKYSLAEDDSTYEGEVKGGGFVIRRGTHFSRQIFGVEWGRTIYGRLYEPARGTIISLEILPRLFVLAFEAFFIGMLIMAFCLIAGTGIKLGDYVYSLFSLIPLGMALVTALAARSFAKEMAGKEIERLNELLDAEPYSGDAE